MASKPTEMCVIETTGAREYKVRMNSSLSMTIITISLSVSISNARWWWWIIIFHREGAVVSRSRSSFSHHVVFWMMMIFLTPCAFWEDTKRIIAEGWRRVSLSVFLSVCLSLSRLLARRGKEQTTQQKPSKKRRRRLSWAAKKKATNSLVVCREKKKKRTNANEFCLFYAQFYVRTRLNDTIFDFFLLCARLCVVSGKRERERERVAMMMF